MQTRRYANKDVSNEQTIWEMSMKKRNQTKIFSRSADSESHHSIQFLLK